ncbi:hypothetical protein H4R27_002178 [Coemansia aciculifera]|nr:hypothetical protein H4R27_002178 [Coemansia aciculifera]
MDNPARDQGDEPNAPVLTLCTFAEKLKRSTDAVKAHNFVLAHFIQILATRATGSAANSHVAELALLRQLLTAPITRRSTAPLSVSSPIAGSATASVPLPRQLTTNLPVGRATAPEKRKGRAAPGDRQATPPLHKRQRMGPQVVEVIEISSDEEGNGPSASMQASTPLFFPTMPPSASSPVAATVAGSFAASVTLARLTTATPSTARLTWPQKGKGRAPPDDGPPTPQLHMRQRVDPWAVEEIVISSDEEGDEPSVNMRASSSARSALPNVSYSSRLGMHLSISDHDHGGNADHDSAEENGSATVIRDSSGEVVTSMRVSVVFGSFFYMTFAMLTTLYRRKFGCRLIPEGADPQVVHEALGALEGFRLHSIPVKRTGSDQAVSLTVLLRDGSEFDTMCQDLKRRLGLTSKPISPIPGPLLCYSVVRLGCIPLGQLSGDVLQGMLPTITGVDFDMLPIVTSKGIRRMSYDNICRTACKWVHDLCRFTIKGGHMDKTMDVAVNCYKAYMSSCYAKRNPNADLDPKGKIAKRMLKDDVCHSQLLLGIRKPEFRTLFKQLAHDQG